MIARVLLFIACGALTLTLPTGASSWLGTSEAAAHPAPYPHRHYRRVQPQHQSAPDPRDGRLYLRFGGVATYLADTNEPVLTGFADGGGGFSLGVGMRFNRWIAFEASWQTGFHGAGTTLDSAALSALTIDAKIFLTSRRPMRMEPFLQIGAGAYFLHRDNNADTLVGGGFQAGGGIDVWLTPSFAIGVKGLYQGAYVDNGTDYYYPTESLYMSVLSLAADLKIYL